MQNLEKDKPWSNASSGDFAFWHSGAFQVQGEKHGLGSLSLQAGDAAGGGFHRRKMNFRVNEKVENVALI